MFAERVAGGGRGAGGGGQGTGGGGGLDVKSVICECRMCVVASRPGRRGVVSHTQTTLTYYRCLFCLCLRIVVSCRLCPTSAFSWPRPSIALGSSVSYEEEGTCLI